MQGLAAFQADFWAALAAPPGVAARSDWARQPGFAVYRNTVFKACVDALAASYPSLVTLLGADCLRAIAAEHTAQEPPRSAVLADYGASLPDRIAAQADFAQWPWLAAVARLDRAWTESHLAPDARAVEAAELARLSPGALGALRLAPHPSARWAWSAQWPIASLWDSARAGLDLPAELAWVPEGVLIVRPEAQVESAAASPADCAFLDACAAGATVESAAAAALAAEPQANLAAMLAGLLLRGALIHPDPQSTETP